MPVWCGEQHINDRKGKQGQLNVRGKVANFSDGKGQL